MTKERYWVVGGEYTCMGFRELKHGSQRLIGPFEDRAEAQVAWRRLSDETRSLATARFSITAERVVLPQ